MCVRVASPEALPFPQPCRPCSSQVFQVFICQVCQVCRVSLWKVCIATFGVLLTFRTSRKYGAVGTMELANG